jgi:hypothetical protein
MLEPGGFLRQKVARSYVKVDRVGSGRQILARKSHGSVSFEEKKNICMLVISVQSDNCINAG